MGKSPIWTNAPEDTVPPPFPVNTEPHGATYQMVMSEKSGENPTPQDPHWLGYLLPPAIPRPDTRINEFFSGASVLGDDTAAPEVIGKPARGYRGRAALG